MTNLLIPTRNPSAPTGSEFINNNMNTDRITRENNILNELLSGNIPDFLRKFVPVHIIDGSNYIAYLAMPDYLSIGTNEDYIRIPVNSFTAQKVANQFDCTLPTRKIVNDIHKYAINKLSPHPHGPPYDASMMSSERFLWSNNVIQTQMIGKHIDQLTSGHKKDIVLTNKLYPNNPKKRVAIYGWLQDNGVPIQNLNYWSHEDFYTDYVNNARLIANDVMVNSKPMRIQDVFAHPVYSSLISDEGILQFTSY